MSQFREKVRNDLLKNKVIINEPFELRINYTNNSSKSIRLKCRQETVKLWIDRQMKYIFPTWGDTRITELEQENQRLYKELTESVVMEHWQNGYIDRLEEEMRKAGLTPALDNLRGLAQNKK